MQQETDQSQATKSLRNNAAKQMVLDEGNYTPIPNSLREAWRKGIISQKCYDLIHECFEHSETFWLRDDYLLPIFGNCRGGLLEARKEAIARNIIKIHKVRVKRSFVNHYELLPPDQWDLSIVEKPTVETQNQTQSSAVENSTVENSTVEKPTVLTRRTPNKKKLNKKNGGEKRARACAYDQTNELVKKEETPPPSQCFSSSHWVSEYQPSDVTDTLARHKVIPTKVSGEKIWVPDIKTWNKLVSEVWSSSASSEIQADIVRLANWGGKLPKDRDQALALIFELRRLEDQNGSSESHDTVT